MWSMLMFAPSIADIKCVCLFICVAVCFSPFFLLVSFPFFSMPCLALPCLSFFFFFPFFHFDNNHQDNVEWMLMAGGDGYNNDTLRIIFFFFFIIIIFLRENVCITNIFFISSPYVYLRVGLSARLLTVCHILLEMLIKFSTNQPTNQPIHLINTKSHVI